MSTNYEFSQNDLSIGNLASKNMKKLQLNNHSQEDNVSMASTPSLQNVFGQQPAMMSRAQSGSTYNTLAPIKFPNMLPIDDGNENLVSDSTLEAMYNKTNQVMTLQSYYMSYKNVLQNVYKAFYLPPSNDSYQSFILDSNSIYDMLKLNVISNNVNNQSNNSNVLVLYTGLNSNKFLQAFEDKSVDVMYSNIGTNKFDMNQLKFLITNNKYKIICFTYVDESIGVKMSVDEIYRFIKQHSPESYLVMDCNGAISSEPMNLAEYPFDLVFDDSNDLNGPQGMTFGCISNKFTEYLNVLNELGHYHVSELMNLRNFIKSWKLIESYDDDFDLQSNLKIEQNEGIDNALIKVSKVLLLGFEEALVSFINTNLDIYYSKCYELSEFLKTSIQSNLALNLVTDYKEGDHALVNGLTCIQYLNTELLVNYLFNSYNLSVSEGKITNMKMKTSLSKIDVKYFRIKNIQPIIVRDFIKFGGKAEDYPEYKMLLTILKKSIESVDYMSGKKGYSSVSIAETM
ncbi:hypothetical protein ACO0OL_000609 [Hanseniaspora opuntiae]